MTLKGTIKINKHRDILKRKGDNRYDWPLMTGGIEILEPTTLSEARRYLAGASLGDKYAAFAGGYGNSPTYKDAVDIFDKDFVRNNTPTLSEARRYLAGTSLGDEYVVFAGGSGTNPVYKSNVDIFANIKDWFYYEEEL